MKSAFASMPAFEVGGHIVELDGYERMGAGWRFGDRYEVDPIFIISDERC